MKRIIMIFLLAACVLPPAASGQNIDGVRMRQHDDTTGIYFGDVKGSGELADTGDTASVWPVPFVLSPSVFVPAYVPYGENVREYAPLPRPTYVVEDIRGFTGGMTGIGMWHVWNYDHFFSQLTTYDIADVPMLMLGRQMMIGNTLRLGKNLYFLSGILYGGQWGTLGNNWGLGARNGFLVLLPHDAQLVLWSQHFHPMAVYLPVYGPDAGPQGTAIVTPAIPEIFSIGAQASFQAGEFIIGIGASYYYYK